MTAEGNPAGLWHDGCIRQRRLKTDDIKMKIDAISGKRMGDRWDR